MRHTYQLVRLPLEGYGAEHDLAVDAVPPVPRRHSLHEDVVSQRREERRSGQHLAQESDRVTVMMNKIHPSYSVILKFFSQVINF